MKMVFADTLYWYGLSNPRDQWHQPSEEARKRFGDARLVTTDAVLTEFLAAMSGGGPYLRQIAVGVTQTILADANALVIPQTRELFLRGLTLYSQRLDKGYSLVDCISMTVMRDEGVLDALTNDHHFTQEGFNALIQRPK